MLKLYDSFIYLGKCEHMRKKDRKRLRSVWAYDITYLYPVIQEGIDWMKFGLFDSKKLDRKSGSQNIIPAKLTISAGHNLMKIKKSPFFEVFSQKKCVRTQKGITFALEKIE